MYVLYSHYTKEKISHSIKSLINIEQKCQQLTFNESRQATATGLEPTTTQFINKHSTIWLNVWVFFCELSGCAFESSCSHLNSDFAPDIR